MRILIGLIAILAMVTGPAWAQPLAGKALLGALHGGGYVLVMRHANSPAMPPDKATADPENIALERQLDATGRDTTRAMGEVFIKLRIPLAIGLSSPSYRARETARLARFSYASDTALDEGPAGMAADAEKVRADFLRKKAAEAPPPGQNKVIISHAPNIISAFGKQADGIASGEMLVFKPGANSPALVARVKIEEWPKLLAAN